MRSLPYSRLYIRIILLYTISAVSIVFLLSSVLILRSQRFLEEQLAKVRQEQISQLKIYLDENVFNQPRMELINGYFSFSWDYLLPRFFQNEIRDPYDLVRLHRRLMEILSANPHLDSLSLLRFSDDQLISTCFGISDFKALEEDHRYTVLPLSNIQSSQTRYGWYGEEGLVSFFQKIPFTSGDKETGIMVVNLDMAVLEAESRRMAGDGGIRILGSGGGLIADFGPLERAEEERRIFETRSDTSGIIYELSVPDGFFFHDLHVARRYLVASAAGILVLGVILLNLMSSFLYTPFIRIITRLTSLRGDGNSKESVGVLRRADEYLDSLDQRAEERKRILLENQSLNRYKMMMRIADGDFGEADGEQMESLCMVQFSHPWYSMVIGTPPADWLEKTGTSQSQLLDYDLVRGVDDFLIEKYGWRVLVISPRTAHFHLLVNSPFPDIFREVEALKEQIYRQFGIVYSLDVSSAKYRLSLASSAFREAQLVGGYRFYFGDKAVLMYDRRMDRDRIENEVSLYQKQEKAKKLLNALDSRGLSGLIDQVVAEAVEKLTTPSIIRGFLSQIYENAVRMLERVTDDPAGDDGRTNLTAAEQKGKILSVIENRNFVSETAHRERERAFLEKVRNYISEGVDSQMSLESVADRFGVSPGHLGRLLRRNEPEGFKGLLLKSKLDRAVRFLIEDDITVKEISSTLGYSSPAYFSRIFRERYGMTPADFRRDQRCRDVGSSTP